MFDFDLELKKLKSKVPRELIKPFEIVQIAQNDDNGKDEKNEKDDKNGEALSALSGKLESLSLQIEEIYEIVENSSPDGALLKTLVDVFDLLEVFFAAYDSDGAGRRKLREILGEGKIAPLGEAGERLNPDIHKVVGAEYAEGIAAEQVLQVVIPGYSYENKIIRKAKVVVSK